MAEPQRFYAKSILNTVKGEREYQRRLSRQTTRPDMVQKMTIGDTLSAIQYNLDRARQEWYVGSDPHPDAMAYLRKVAALCVQAGEVYGMPEREAK